MIKIKAIKINDLDYKINCPYCKMEVIGYNKELMEKNMIIHINREHEEKEKRDGFFHKNKKIADLPKLDYKKIESPKFKLVIKEKRI